MCARRKRGSFRAVLGGGGKGVILQDRRGSASPRHDGAGLGGLLTGEAETPQKSLGRVRWEGEPKERIGLILPAQACKARESHSPHAHHTLTTRRSEMD